MVNALVNELFDSAMNDSLAHLNVRGLDAACRYLDIPFNYRICSGLNLLSPEEFGPGGWALEICNLLGATNYVNPASCQVIFDPSAFARRGISLPFAQAAEFACSTAPYRTHMNPTCPS